MELDLIVLIPIEMMEMFLMGMDEILHVVLNLDGIEMEALHQQKIFVMKFEVMENDLIH